MTTIVDDGVREAATVLVTRDAPGGLEVLMVRRTSRAAFAAGAMVFPGGRVDSADAAAALEFVTGRDGGVPDGTGPAFWYAAVREAFEESGLLLAEPVPEVDLAAVRLQVNAGELAFEAFLGAHDLRIDGARVAYISRWVTPKGEARRFDTRFLLMVAPEGQVALQDEAETTEAVWVRPWAAIERTKAGELFLLPPTIANLNWLARFDTTAEALAAGLARRVEPVRPEIRTHDDGSVRIHFGDDDPLGVPAEIVLRPRR